MGQVFLRPDADQSDGSWLNEASSGTNLFTSVDEASTPNDSDYIQSSITVGDKVRLRLSDPGTTVAQPLIVRYRGKRGSGSAAAGITGRLFQGTTQIATWLQAVTDTLTTYTYTLTSGEFSSISDFNDLYVEFEYSLVWWILGSSLDLDLQNGRYFDGAAGASITSYLSSSRASSGYATNADGTLTSFASNAVRIGVGTGLLNEDSRTNVVLWNRDLSNAAWTKTNITAALDQTGVDGGANSASSIVATAGNGTVLQTTSVASGGRWQSAYVKRITGSGTINMTMDNGSTWTAITVTNAWTRVEIPTQTLANPTVGFRIVTNGDKIAVDLVQNEDNNIFASSPIATTTSALTRASDANTCISTLNSLLTALPHSLLVDVSSLYAIAVSGTGGRIVGDTGGTADLLGADSNVLVSIYNGSDFSQVTLGNSLTFFGGAKVAEAQDVSGWSVVGGGGSVGTAAHNAIYTTVTIGNASGPTAGNPGKWSGYYRRITVWNSRLADATLQTLTAP